MRRWLLHIRPLGTRAENEVVPEIKAILEGNGLLGHPYAELFAGGAGLAIKLLLKGDVSSIVINDYDRAVYCMWDAIVNHGEELCGFIDSVALGRCDLESDAGHIPGPRWCRRF